MKHLMILGGGYGGLKIAQGLLDSDIPDDVEVTLIDRMPYQGLKTEYDPLVSGLVAESDLRRPYPVDPRLHLHYGEVMNIDLTNKRIGFLNGDELQYDQLIIGLGCVDNYHNTPGAQQHTNTIQT